MKWTQRQPVVSYYHAGNEVTLTMLMMMMFSDMAGPLVDETRS